MKTFVRLNKFNLFTRRYQNSKDKSTSFLQVEQRLMNKCKTYDLSLKFLPTQAHPQAFGVIPVLLPKHAVACAHSGRRVVDGGAAEVPPLAEAVGLQAELVRELPGGGVVPPDDHAPGPQAARHYAGRRCTHHGGFK